MIPIHTLCQQYLEVFPQERETLQPLCAQLQQKGDADITVRSQFGEGHITANVIIVSLSSKRVLLIHHQALNMQLQPGGHIDPGDTSLLAAAYRECEEETGITAQDIRYIPLSEQEKELPFNIAVYNIPEAPLRGEPRHLHYDFLYLFTVRDEVHVTSADAGIANHQWVPLTVFAKNLAFSRQAEKVEKLLTAA